ncbi:hypothetical protein [Streptomyces roseifaciens]|uniref:hypothetical protein n=1 Tax=Streptomyces roseifaciens TaxID=1488406 RepID=UPI00071817A5|nr:hypothetical protein [Streptomyces roseifaciens]
MKLLVTLNALSALSAVTLGMTAAPAHASGTDDPLAPVQKLSADVQSTVCRQDLTTVPVVSQYAGVVKEACGSKGSPHAGRAQR